VTLYPKTPEAVKRPGATDDGRSSPNSASARATLRCGDLEIDGIIRRATLAGAVVPLTGREFAVLVHLADRANRVVKGSDLLANVWSVPTHRSTNVLAVYVRRLRRKLGSHAWMLETVRGFGYCLRPHRDGLRATP
jgi:DNA-binding response OmpR family regulator